MVNHCIRLFLFVFIGVMPLVTEAYSLKDKNEQHALVSMRLIGHELLLSAGDSLSRVLPIESEDGQYRIRFESDFEFDPEKLISIVDSVLKKTGIVNSYIVEVLSCGTEEVVYSFEIGNQPESDVVACRTRLQPLGCYSILISVLDENSDLTNVESVNPGVISGSDASTKETKYMIVALLFFALFVLISSLLYFRRKRQKEIVDPNMISIGICRFDSMNSELLIEDQKFELTSKESDLLLLLYKSVNETIGREVLLNNVWGDEGDYVGRTLDVFISKLRKKLELDTSLKIVNIRGVGYKLVMNT